MSDFDISAEEMKLWQEKQQKRDKLSRIMGEYLLKGYRMLDSYCPVCNGILMSGPGEDSSSTMCIDCIQDAAVYNPPAVNSRLTPFLTPTIKAEAGSPRPIHPPQPTPTGPEQTAPQAMPTKPATPLTTPVQPTHPTVSSLSLDQEEALVLEATRKVLINKLKWAQNELEHCSSAECCHQICQLIQGICAALRDLRNIRGSVQL